MNKQICFMFLIFCHNFAISSSQANSSYADTVQSSLWFIPDSQLNQFQELICFGCLIYDPRYSTLSQEFVLTYPQALQDSEWQDEDFKRTIVVVTTDSGTQRYHLRNRSELLTFTRMLGRITPSGKQIQALDFFYVTQYAKNSSEQNIRIEEDVSLQYLREQAARKNL